MACIRRSRSARGVAKYSSEKSDNVSSAAEVATKLGTSSDIDKNLPRMTLNRRSAVSWLDWTSLACTFVKGIIADFFDNLFPKPAILGKLVSVYA